MHKSYFIWVLLAFSVWGGICGCKQSAKTNSGTAKNSDTTVPVAPPYESPPGVEMSTVKKCYNNQGLKYDVTVVLEYQTDTSFTGSVISKDLETKSDETTMFSGKVKNGMLQITVKGKWPVIGAATEWTDKPWQIEKVVGKSTADEILHIPVSAKNYETNKWEEKDYLFAAVDCK